MDALAELKGNYAAGDDWLLGRATGNRHSRRAVEARQRRTGSQTALDQARAIARDIGAMIWEARDAAELDDILDAHANDLTAHPAARLVAATLNHGKIPGLPDSLAFVRGVAARASGDNSVVADLLAGIRIGAVISGLFRKRASSERVREPELGRSDWDGFDLYAAAAPMLNTLLAHARGTACLAALVDLILSDRPPQPRWRVERVARTWVTGERTLLVALSASYENEDIPEDLVPRAIRLERDGIMARHNEEEAVLESLIERMSAAQ